MSNTPSSLNTLCLSALDCEFLTAVGIAVPDDAEKPDLVTLYRLREDLIPGSSNADPEAAI